MTQTLEMLEHQTHSMRGIRSVVHTMKTLSAINAAPYEQAARSIQHYRDIVLKGLQAVLHAGAPLDLSLQSGAMRVLLIFGSDHGLCGNYNERLAGTLISSVRNDDTALLQVLCVGAQMKDALSGLGMPVRELLFTPANADGLARLASELVTHVDKLRAQAPNGAISVELLYTARLNDGQQATKDQQLLPLEASFVKELQEKPWDSTSLPWMRESAETLFAALIRNYLFASIYNAAAEAMATENAARLARMQQAERSVDEQLLAPADQTRSARQSQITEELLEVIVGFEALRGSHSKKNQKTSNNE